MIKNIQKTILFISFMAVLFLFLVITSQKVEATTEQGNAFLYFPLIINGQAVPIPTVPPTQESSFSDQVVSLVNQQRVAGGCGELLNDERLQTAAYKHSEDMALNDFFSHTGSNGSSPSPWCL